LGIGVLAASLYGLPLAGLAARVGRRSVLAVIVLVAIIVMFLIDRSANRNVLVLGRHRVHVDLDSGSRHLVANRVSVRSTDIHRPRSWRPDSADWAMAPTF
jgi:hypothetical protein